MQSRIRKKNKCLLASIIVKTQSCFDGLIPLNPYGNFNSRLSSLCQVLSKQTGVIRNRELFCQVGNDNSGTDPWGMEFFLHESETKPAALASFVIVMKALEV